MCSSSTIPPKIDPTSTEQTSRLSIECAEVLIASQGSKLPVYVAKPDSGAQLPPIILVIHDDDGVDDDIRQTCQRFASIGYLALAPNLLFRAEVQAPSSAPQGLSHSLLEQISLGQVLSDLDHVAHWAINQGGNRRQLAICGFGWGGTLSWLHASHTPQLRAAIAWDGALEKPHTLKQPLNPLMVADQLIAPVLGIYAGKDPQISLESVDRMRQALLEVEDPSQIVVYAEARNGFYKPQRETYHAEITEQAWQSMLSFLELQLALDSRTDDH